MEPKLGVVLGVWGAAGVEKKREKKKEREAALPAALMWLAMCSKTGKAWGWERKTCEAGGEGGGKVSVRTLRVL
jgi:hypothetical protein